MKRQTQVAIIGCGPVGALLGNLLGTRGISNVIVEKQATPYTLPRAVHFDAETMRILQSVGLADVMLPDTMVGKGMLFQDGAGKVLVDWSRAQETGPYGWHESYRFHQPALEATLRNGLSRFPECEVIWGHAVTDVRQDADGVDLELADGKALRTDYVVGCDGAQSFLRELLDVEAEDLGFKEKWLVVDLQITSAKADRGDYTIQFCDADHPATYLRGIGDRRRWEIRLEDGDPEPVDDAAVWKNLSFWVSSDDATLERSAIYTFRSIIVDEWRKGRCFLAGDAAHLTPPFMGQGICAGARDAANLAWKLAAVLKGAGDELLETYQSERRPNVHSFIDMAVRLGRLINQTAAGQAPQGVMKSLWPPLGPGLGVRDGIVGTHAPQVRLDDGRLSDDVSGGGFFVFARTEFDCKLPVITVASDWLTENGVFGIVVRPDGYIFATANDEADILRAIEDCSRL